MCQLGAYSIIDVGKEAGEGLRFRRGMADVIDGNIVCVR